MNTNSQLNVPKIETLADDFKCVNNPGTTRYRNTRFPDIGGACLSGLCLLHCMLIPMIAPFLAVRFIDNEIAHFAILVPGLVLSGYTVLKTRSVRRRTIKIVCFLAGWALFLLAELNHEFHLYFYQFMSVTLIISAHVMGLWERRC